MKYFSNKPAPSQGPKLPMPGAPSAVFKEQPLIRPGVKRKQPDESGNQTSMYPDYQLIYFSQQARVLQAVLL